MTTPVTLFPVLVFENNGGGAPLANGTVNTFLANTTTPQITYTDGTGATSAGSVLTLNSNGQANNGAGVWLVNGVNYKLVIKDSNGATVQTIDNVAGGGFTGNSSFVTAAAEATLTGSRTLTSGTSVTITDNGAASTIVAKRAALTGDVTASADSNTTTIANAAVTLAKMANIATGTVIGRSTAGTGVPEALTPGTSMVIGSGTVQRAALTGDVTASQDSNATTIASGAVTMAKLANLATNTVIGRPVSGTGVPSAITLGSGLAMDGTSVLQTQIPDTSSNAASYTALAADRGKLLQFNTQTTFTLSLTAAATLGNGWYCYVKNNNSGTMTVDPNAAEVINGVATMPIYAGCSALIVTDGSSFFGWCFPNTTTTSYTYGVSSAVGAASLFTAIETTQPGAAINITANTDNLAISSTYVLLTATGAWNLTGVVPIASSVTGSAAGGQHLYLSNTSASTITLKHLTTSTAANQFQLSTGADIALLTNQTMHLIYDGTATKWRNIL